MEDRKKGMIEKETINTRPYRKTNYPKQYNVTKIYGYTLFR
jgi:hypothetical protein